MAFSVDLFVLRLLMRVQAGMDVVFDVLDYFLMRFIRMRGREP